MNNIINTDTSEFGLSEAQVKSWFIEREITVLWSSPFEPVAPFEFYAESEPPEHDRDTHKAVQTEPEQYYDIESQRYWPGLVQQWKIVPLNADELAQREAERLAEEQAQKEARRIIITRTQGLKALFRSKGIKQQDVQALIDAIEDEDERYEAELSFNAANWYSDDEFVLRMAPHIGAESEEDFRTLFIYAQTI